MSNCTSSACRTDNSGFSLVELMVAIALGLLLLIGLSTLFANTITARSEIDKASRQIDSGRYALQLLTDDIRHAGYYGPLNNAPSPPASLPDPCSTSTSDVTAALGLPIQGYFVSGATAPITCLQSAAAGYKASTAVLVVRRASTNTAAGFTAGEFNIQVSGCQGDPVPYLVGTSVGTFTLHANTSPPGCKPISSALAAAVEPLYVRIYYVSTCSNVDCSASGADSVPTLKRMDVKPGATVLVPLVDGIENLQFDYGVDTNLNGAPESYTATNAPPSSISNWANVMSVRVHLLSRNVDPTGSYTDAKTYALGDVSATPAGNYKRHAYSELVRLNNPAGRRE
jgi:type IV pilus assembly protein PilW